MSKEVHRIYFCKDGAISDTQIREGEDVTDTLKRCFKKISDLEAKLAESEKKNFELVSKLNLKEHKPAFCTLADRDCEALGQVEELKQQLADTEAQNKRVLEKLDLLVRSNQELEKENKQLKDKLHTSEQETMHFHNKYFAEKQIAIEELNKVKEFANETSGIVGHEWRIDKFRVLEQIDNQIKAIKEMSDE